MSEPEVPCARRPSARRTFLVLPLVVGAPTTASAEWVLRCNGLVATIVGTDRDDVIEGTEGPDVIATRNGDDIVHARGGDDTVCAGDGNDELYGGSGDDWLYSEHGSYVTLTGDAGNDTLVGLAGQDTRVSYLEAPQGVVVDLAAGTASGDGDDVLIHIIEVQGSQYDDVLRGGDEDELYLDGGGNNLVIGRGGNDAVILGCGDDVVRGGSGHDYVELDNPSCVDQDSFLGGRGSDTVGTYAGADDIDGGPGWGDAIAFNVHEAPTGVQVRLRDGVAEGGFGSKTFTGIEWAIGTDQDDVLLGTARRDGFDGWGGDDLIRGGGGRDVAFGQDGDDRIEGGRGDDYLIGMEDRDVVEGGAGFDTCEAERSKRCEREPSAEESPDSLAGQVTRLSRSTGGLNRS